MSCLTAALTLSGMILMPVAFGMDDDKATNDEPELLRAAAAAASLVLRRAMLKTVLKRIRNKLAKPDFLQRWSKSADQKKTPTTVKYKRVHRKTTPDEKQTKQKKAEYCQKAREYKAAKLAAKRSQPEDSAQAQPVKKKRGADVWKPQWAQTTDKNGNMRTWLYEDNGRMFCHVCKQAGKESVLANQGSAVMRSETFTKHHEDAPNAGPEHFKALAADLDLADLAAKFKRSQMTALDKMKEGLTNLIRNVFWCAKEDVALLKLRSMVDCDIGKGLSFPRDDKGNLIYVNNHSGREFMMAVAAALRDAQWAKILASPVISVLVDESTDISTS